MTGGEWKCLITILIFHQVAIKSGCRLTQRFDTLILSKFLKRDGLFSFGKPYKSQTCDTLIKSKRHVSRINNFREHQLSHKSLFCSLGNKSLFCSIGNNSPFSYTLPMCLSSWTKVNIIVVLSAQLHRQVRASQLPVHYKGCRLTQPALESHYYLDFIRPTNRSSATAMSVPKLRSACIRKLF